MTHYYLKMYAGKREVTPVFSPDWYGLSENEINRVAHGLCAGMYQSYKHPSVEIYQVTDGKMILKGRIN